MANDSPPRPIHVTCYSGRTYADRPASFVWQGIRYEVKDIEREWLEPGERHFVLKTRGGEESGESEKDDRRFELCYHEREDSWSLREL